MSDGTKIDYPGSPCWHCGSSVHDTAGHAHTAPIMDGQPTTMPKDGECVKCHEAMSIRDGEEPTMYCDHCAHDQIATLTTRISELEKGLKDELEVCDAALGGDFVDVLGVMSSVERLRRLLEEKQ